MTRWKISLVDIMIKVLFLFICACLVWIALSVLEVVIKNGMAHPEYLGINFFNLFCK